MIYTHKFDTIFIFSLEKGQKCLSTMWNEQNCHPFIVRSKIALVWFRNAPIVTTWVKHAIFF